MKKLYTLIIAVMITAITFGQTTIIEWTFPNESADVIADAGIPENLDKEIYTVGGTSDIQFKNGFEGKAAQATQWDNGSGSKAWEVSFTSIGYGDLRLSSKQTSGGNDPGPRDFKIQYKIGEDGTWTDLENAVVEVQNDWTTGVIEAVELPDECNNRSLIFIRWIMTSNINSIGETVEASGKSKIDNILVTGEDNTGLTHTSFADLSVYPNPCQDFIRISNNKEIGKLEIFSVSGQLAYSIDKIQKNGIVDVSELMPGVYFVVVWSKTVSEAKTTKLIIQ